MAQVRVISLEVIATGNEAEQIAADLVAELHGEGTVEVLNYSVA